MKRALLLVAIVAGCTDDAEVVDVGVIYTTVTPSIEYPEIAHAGEPFTIVVHTIGDGCWRHERTDLELFATTATITSYDRGIDQGLCDDAANIFDHAASLQFDEAGEKAIYVRARIDARDRPVTDVPITIAVQ